MGSLMKVTEANVGSAVVAAIPELRAGAAEWDDLGHLQFMELWLWTEFAARNGNIPNVLRAVRLVDEILLDCDSEIKNAVTVSFLEHIDPEDAAGSQIFEALTPVLRTQWHALDAYMQNLIGKSLRGSVARNAQARKS
jgi:hypothetical protein